MRNKHLEFLLLILVLCLSLQTTAISQEITSDIINDVQQDIDALNKQEEGAASSEKPAKSDSLLFTQQSIFDDKMLMDGYSQKYRELPKEILRAMIEDETLNGYKTAAAVRVFTERYLPKIVSKEKKRIEKTLWRRLNRSDSPFVQVEIMHALCCLDRYKYYKPMVPALIQKLNHYNSAVNEMAFNNLESIIAKGNNRSREARILFNTLRKLLFLSRKRLENVTVPDIKLSRQIKLLRWAIKVLGTEELKKLPKEVYHLL